MMRVITGSARGRRLETLFGEEVTRPTTESVKEALFSMIQFEIEGKKVLDLFAGSGQLGIEALSRGARHCTFLENNRDAVRVVENNVSHCGFKDNSNIVFADAVSFLMRKENFDIAFVDPPYNLGLVDKCLPLLLKLMSEDGIVVCETSACEDLPESIDGWYADRVRRYGKTKLTLYRKEK
ncbi:MAG: 16S rRNA (guanine(966)-N(2))-methyltransferase RsmD [Eubacterium sp.]|nr:16S rRNA (guanine(966)-N(2))-methyltransferase RsmD [Eubacterium sp.]